MQILMIDDEESILEAYAALLMEHKLSVKTLNNAYKGMEFLKTNQVDVIISDLSMPDFNGIEFFHKIKEELDFSGVFIFVTGFWDESHNHLLNEGVSKVFSKPLSHHDLVVYLKECGAS